MLNGKKDRVGFGMAMGIIVGTVIGALTNNVGLWIAVWSGMAKNASKD